MARDRGRSVSCFIKYCFWYIWDRCQPFCLPLSSVQSSPWHIPQGTALGRQRRRMDNNGMWTIEYFVSDIKYVKHELVWKWEKWQIWERLHSHEMMWHSCGSLFISSNTLSHNTLLKTTNSKRHKIWTRENLWFRVLGNEEKLWQRQFWLVAIQRVHFRWKTPTFISHKEWDGRKRKRGVREPC